MLSLLSYTVDINRFEICVFVSALIYVILHYIIFNIKNEFVMKYKYVFYVIVIIDFIYAISRYKQLNKQIVDNTIEDNKTDDTVNEMYIEKPYVEKEEDHRQFIPFTGSSIIPPMPTIPLHPMIIKQELQEPQVQTIIENTKQKPEQINNDQQQSIQPLKDQIPQQSTQQPVIQSDTVNKDDNKNEIKESDDDKDKSELEITLSSEEDEVINEWILILKLKFIMDQLTLVITFVIIFICSLIIINSIMKVNYNNKTKYVYRYIPKKYIDQQYDDNYANDLFKNLFTTTSPWLVDSVRYRDTNKMEQVNKYFVSQV